MTTEIAIGVTDETIDQIVKKFEVSGDFLQVHKNRGLVFVGEDDCEWWWGVLDPRTFYARYEVPETPIEEEWVQVARRGRASELAGLAVHSV